MRGCAGGLLKESPRPPRTFQKQDHDSPESARMRGSGIFHAVFLYPAAPDTRGRACPAGHFLRRLRQCRFRLSPRDARGEAPCIRKLKTPPSPEGKSALRARVGGWGQKSKPKAGLAGDKEGTSPAGQRQGKVSQRGRKLFQESPGASLSPPGTFSAGSANTASGSAPGMQGAKPLA